MTIVEREVVVRIKVQAETFDDAYLCFDRLRERLDAAVPKMFLRAYSDAPIVPILERSVWQRVTSR